MAIHRPGIAYAATAQGYELPVIDVTHAAFTVADDSASGEALRAAFIAMGRQNNRVPRFLMKFFMRSFMRRSLLARALFDHESTVLPGLNTYLMKLGADNLVPPFDSDIDKRLAASPATTSMRMRLQQVAGLVAQGLEKELAARANVPLHLINIGGGTAIDSLNTLILLRRASAELLARSVTIHVLDIDAEGPSFGRRALAALGAESAPLAGLDMRFVHVTHDWNAVAALEKMVRALSIDEAIVAASSEGALFEYGDDALVVANLKALYAGGNGARLVAGSVTRDDEIIRGALEFSPFKLVPRGVERFARLLRGTGYSLARTQSAPMSDQVLLRAD